MILGALDLGMMFLIWSPTTVHAERNDTYLHCRGCFCGLGRFFWFFVTLNVYSSGNISYGGYSTCNAHVVHVSEGKLLVV